MQLSALGHDQWPIPDDLMDHKDPVLGLFNLTTMLFTREEVMQTVQQQVALANMQELLVKVGQVHSSLFVCLQDNGNQYPDFLYTSHIKVTDKCFKKCITSPGSSMGSSDQKCVAMCMDRFVPHSL